MQSDNNANHDAAVDGGRSIAERLMDKVGDLDTIKENVKKEFQSMLHYLAIKKEVFDYHLKVKSKLDLQDTFVALHQLLNRISEQFPVFTQKMDEEKRELEDDVYETLARLYQCDETKEYAKNDELKRYFIEDSARLSEVEKRLQEKIESLQSEVGFLTGEEVALIQQEEGGIDLARNAVEKKQQYEEVYSVVREASERLKAWKDEG